jgi:hypothetical protein
VNPMPMLFVKCHQCQAAFPSGIAHEADMVGRVTMFNVLERCPECGSVQNYQTKDFFFEGSALKKDAGGEATMDAPGAGAPNPEEAIAESGEPAGEKHPTRVIGGTQVSS